MNPFKLALGKYFAKKKKLPKRISQISQVYFGEYTLFFIIAKDPMKNSSKYEFKWLIYY